MNKELLITYPDQTANELKIKYQMANEGNIHTINCEITNKVNLPDWLQLKKFTFESLRCAKQKYALLFNQLKYTKNLETILFMDEVYEEIMNQENLKIST